MRGPLGHFGLWTFYCQLFTTERYANSFFKLVPCNSLKVTIKLDPKLFQTLMLPVLRQCF